MAREGKNAQTFRPLDRRTEMIVASCAIAITGLAVAVLPWWLGYGFNGATEIARLRLDTVRTSLGFTAGLGGAIALWLAIRRQRSTELDLQQNELIAENTRHDATERRITEQYVQASSQLGSERIAVQLAGVYAFERLAHDNPQLRQVVVDLLCAYLRMSTKIRKAPAYRTPNPSGYRSINLHRSVSPLIGGVRDGIRQAADIDLHDREVQSAIRDVLIKHTRVYDVPVLSFGPPTVADCADFWPSTSIDLSGSILESWNLSGCRFQRVNFKGAIFTGETDLRYVECDHDADFEGCRFEGYTTFYKAKFRGNLDLAGAKLRNEFRFEHVECDGDGWADFSQATFSYLSWFDGSQFNSVHFDGTQFEREVWFNGTHFVKPVDLSEAVYKISARFEGATFEHVDPYADPGRLKLACEKNPQATISLP